MSLFGGIDISASGMTAERARTDVIAQNLANTNTPGYRRQVTLLQSIPLSFADRLRGASGGVRVSGVVDDGAPERLVYDPGNPQANAQGYVAMPNVNPVTEMTDLITSSRAYEANTSALNTSKVMYQRTWDVLR
jgi:flagellar basal-body rod protein FlgC